MGRVSQRNGPARQNFARVPTVIVALDVPTAADAVRLVEQLGTGCSFYKVGSELFTATGPAMVDYLRARGANVFLDLKFHDIPNTVERAAAAAAAAGARLITVHAVAGPEAVRAAVKGAAAGVRQSGTKCEVLAVTVLTSLDARALGASWGRKIARTEREVLRLADSAVKAGAHGIVCSGLELESVRGRFANRIKVLVAGVRPRGSARGDQVRVITPVDAANGGADYIVLGRTVTHAVNPVAALREVGDSLARPTMSDQR